LAKAAVAVQRYGVTGLIIDPYNEIEAQMPNNTTEHQYIAKLLSKCKRFAKSHQVHIWIVAHPTKQTKDKDGNIQVPGGYDISGSANWLNKADNLIVVHRPAGNNMTEIHIKKVKPKYAGRQGICNLTYDRDTGIYSVPEADAVQMQYAKEKPKTNKNAIEAREYNSDLEIF
jgi:twinkle protein